MMKKCLEESDGLLIRIKKPNMSEEQIVTHWGLVLTKIKPEVQEERQDDPSLKEGRSLI